MSGGGVRPTVVELPLREIGRRAGQLARQLVETGAIPEVTMIPCALRSGDSVATVWGYRKGSDGGGQLADDGRNS